MRLDIKILIISLIFFLFSLTQDAYSTIDSSGYIKSANSFYLLLVGWIGAIMGEGGAAICWVANPLIFIAWVFYRKNLKISLISAVFSLVFSLLFLFFKEVIVSEAPTFLKIIELKLGYWLWVLSIVIFTIGILVVFLKNNTVKSKS